MGPNGAEPRAGEVVREEFGATQTSALAETATTAAASQARAEIESRFVMAVRRPRDWDDVRQKLLKECARPSFAAVALYHKPIGKGVEGPSIRLAEAALRVMGNVIAPASTVYDDAQKRIVRVMVTDLESNTTYPKDVVITKTVERSSLKDGQKVLGQRTNSYGKPVYIVEATDDDILNKENALVSKALRTSGLRLLPGDILEECIAAVKVTLARETAADPDAARKKVSDAFAALNVMPSALKEYLGHELGQSTPAEIEELRALYNAIKDGEATWGEALEAKRGARQPDGEKPAQSPRVDALREKLDKTKKKSASPREAWEPCPGCERSPDLIAEEGHRSGCPHDSGPPAGKE